MNREGSFNIVLANMVKLLLLYDQDKSASTLSLWCFDLYNSNLEKLQFYDIGKCFINHLRFIW